MGAHHAAADYPLRRAPGSAALPWPANVGARCQSANVRGDFAAVAHRLCRRRWPRRRDRALAAGLGCRVRLRQRPVRLDERQLRVRRGLGRRRLLAACVRHAVRPPRGVRSRDAQVHVPEALVWSGLHAAHVCCRVHLATRLVRHHDRAVRVQTAVAGRRVCHRRVPCLLWAL